MKKRIFLFLVTGLLIMMTVNVHAQFGRKLTQADIDTYGTKAFDEPDMEKMFRIVKEVLLGMDYQIELENFDKGLIKTKRKIIGGTGSYNAAQVRLNYRQYYAYVSETSDGKIKVAFAPKIFIGEADVSTKSIWVLRGAGGEYKLWENLFASIEERL
jgi:hypothetical protein